MQEPGPRRTTPPFAGVDLRRPRGYLASAPAEAEAPAQAETGDPCPRCESLDTKFCYYNNYNTSQPRHYCKSCRRYWTKGGSLRNVPVGGASRKSSSASSPSAPKRTKNSKRRRVAPALEPEQPSTDASTAAAADAVATTETATESTADDPAAPPAADGGFTAAAADAATTEAVAKSTADDPAPPAAADGGFTDPPVALGVGLADAGGKEPSDASPFEWPSGCDLGSYWGNGVFADTDPALFLNQP